MHQLTSILVPGYTIKEVLGTGGSATVFLARHEALQRDVALKILNIELAANPDVCQRFVREALDTASISDHPNIMTIHDAGHHSNVYFIALQYLPGLSLRDQIEAGSSIVNPWNIMYQLANALAHVHRKGFVHRDIKPANVLFNMPEHPILADFGVAQLESNLTKLAGSQLRPGTTKYMSPEQVQGAVSADTRSDLYSLGLVFHEMLTGKSPYLSTIPPTIHPSSSYTSSHRDEHTCKPRPRLPTSFVRFQEIIDQLLQQNPEDRLQSADQLLTALELLKDSSDYNSGSTVSTSHNEASIKLNATKKTRYKAVPITTALLTLVTLMTNSSHTSDLIRAQTITTQCPVIGETQAQMLGKLLKLAKMHDQVGRLAYPPGSNAIEAYSKALDIDPCNRFIVDSLQNLQQKNLELHSKVDTNRQYSITSDPHIKEANAETATYDKLDFGRYHALIIGNQFYDNLVDLSNAKHDTVAIEDMLAQRFGFNTTLLQNATQKQILTALEQLRATLKSQDNLLIFYMGHGEIDSQTSRGYWLPADANLSDTSSWIPNQTVKFIVDSMLAKHILIIANKCYSDELSTSELTHALPELKIATEVDWLRANLPVNVRAALCVNKHSDHLFMAENAQTSPFTKAFIDTLENSSKPTDTYHLLQKMQEHLDKDAQKKHKQSSFEYAPINNSSHQSGEFVFVPRKQK